ncbi:formate dehydrogenase accessory sulfurtransferase FdhD [Sphingobium sp.]|uniref:formate dehydrogenase accessory sulfurtransferase FdhD n=1 Tax=Sphingobium sp. TaxID=1912891 RepID=UPI0028BEC457|nr:formate dehydrogenase accessory sulfurtransferase FdhD [Sphingobium sp.]
MRMPPDAALAVDRVPARTLRFDAGADQEGSREVPLETPVALEYDGVGYAVMLATPADLDDYAVGFTLSERLATTIEDIADVQASELPRGWVVRISLRGRSGADFMDRVRLRLSEGSCGLCGLETIEQVLRPLPRLTPGPHVTRAAVARALAAIGDRQPLGRATGAAHAAAFCAPDGTLLAVREDIGRHNALDKLVGAALRAGLDLHAGFLLLTARCSYELVEKAVTAGCPMLVTISAPTSLAVERAEAAGLTLVSLARRDSMLLVNDPHGSLLE